jgi:hypothetical protein
MPAGKNSAIIKPQTPMVRDQTAFQLGTWCSPTFCVVIAAFVFLLTPYTLPQVEKSFSRDPATPVVILREIRIGKPHTTSR